MSTTKLRVAVIGGGPAGLVTLKHLLEANKAFPGANIEARLFEAHDGVGGVFDTQVYEDAELVSSKYLTTFSDFRLPLDVPDFLSATRYLQYLNDYADHFGLRKHIQFGTTLHSVRPHPSQPGHLLRFGPNGDDETHFDAVAICTGLHHVPLMPKIPGLNLAPGASKIEVFHSVDMKTRSQFGENKTVLILGAGETAMDIGFLAATSPTKHVIMSHRDGFTLQPKIIPKPWRGGRPRPHQHIQNKPVDCSVASLFDTAYAPPLLQRSSLQWTYYDGFIKYMTWMISGTTAGVDQWVGGIDPSRFHADAVMLCKSDRAQPYISEQYRSQSAFNKWRTWFLNVPIKPTGGKKIDIAPWPSHFDKDGFVHFQRNKRPESKVMEQMEEEMGIRPDIVVYATGYRREFPYLPKDDPRCPSVDEAKTRGIYRDIEDGIAYIGFVRPSLGAIPPLAELQAQLWVRDLVACPKYHDYFDKTFKAPVRSGSAVAPYDLSYKLNCRSKDHDFTKTRMAVDHESYAYQLAVDIGAAPTWWYVWSKFGSEVFFTWAMGSNFTPKFRLTGPWSNRVIAEQAASLMKKDGELGSVVRQSGGPVYLFFYTIVPLIIFGPMCIVLNILALLWQGFLFLLGLSGVLNGPGDTFYEK